MATEQWRNRITGHGEESPENLLANPRNFRIHPRGQQDALQGVLDEVGIVDEVIVNARTGFLVNGHLRVMLAMRSEQPTIPVKYVDLSEQEEALILATFDPISALAATDAAILDDLLRDVQTSSAAVQEMLAELANETGLYIGEVLRYGAVDVGRSPGEQLDGFKNATIRQIVLMYPLKGAGQEGGYEWAIALLEEICEEYEFETNTDAVTWLLGEYQRGRNEND